MAGRRTENIVCEEAGKGGRSAKEKVKAAIRKAYRRVVFGKEPIHQERHIEMRIGFRRTRRNGRHMVSRRSVRPAPPAE